MSKSRALLRGGAAVLLTLAGSAALAAPTLKGDYMEARTANIYIGACHANGEVVTTGREAIMAWNIKEGEVDGYRMNGLNVVAVVVGNENLGDCKTPAAKCGARKTVLYVDSKANEGQKQALAWALNDRFGKALGTVVGVKSAPIQFTRKGQEFAVRVPDVLEVKATALKKSCCIMPHEVWYQPMIEVKNSVVGTCSINEFKGTKELHTKWRRLDENSTYVAEFGF
jgi:hypothetical protein